MEKQHMQHTDDEQVIDVDFEQLCARILERANEQKKNKTKTKTSCEPNV